MASLAGTRSASSEFFLQARAEVQVRGLPRRGGRNGDRRTSRSSWKTERCPGRSRDPGKPFPSGSGAGRSSTEPRLCVVRHGDSSRTAALPRLLRAPEAPREAAAPLPGCLGSHLRQRQAQLHDGQRGRGHRHSSPGAQLSELRPAPRHRAPLSPQARACCGGHLKSRATPRALPARFTSTLASAQRVTSGSSAIARDLMPGSRDSPGAGPSLSGTE